MDLTMLETIRAHGPDAWRVTHLVDVDWYDGVWSGLAVLAGPERIAVIVERIGVAQHARALYQAWVVPDGAARVAAMGEAMNPERPWLHAFTEAAPMDVDAVDAMLRAADPRALFVQLDPMSDRVLALGVIERPWRASPTLQVFGAAP